MSASILVVEENKSLQQYIKKLLVENGYLVKMTSNTKKAMKIVEKALPDLLILDINLQQQTGKSICRLVKDKFPSLPVIILTRKYTLNAALDLELCADDFIKKPFTAGELIVRVKVHLKKSNQEETMLRVADLILDPTTYEIMRGKKHITFSVQEFKILHYLMLIRIKCLLVT